MPSLKETIEQFLLAFNNYIISEEKFFLFMINRSANLDYSCSNFSDVQGFAEAKGCTEFRFKKTYITRLKHVLQIPYEITCYNHNDIKAKCTEAICIFLRRLYFST